jgi:membrane protein
MAAVRERGGHPGAGGGMTAVTGPKAVWRLLSATYTGWSEDKAPRLGAALAYYTVFSLAPLLVITISIVGLFLGAEAARGQIVGQLQALVGPEGGKAIETMIEHAGRERNSGIVAGLLGLATLLLGATGVFGELQDSLNTIWGVQPRPGRGILGILKDRFVSFAMVLGIAFLLLVSLVISAALAALGTVLGGSVAEGPLHVANLVASFGVVTFLFAAMYKYVPDVTIEWRDVWIGAAVTSLLFTIGELAIGLYLGKGSIGSAYGAAGSLVILLLWVYYSAQILFVGAEFTKVYARAYGSGFRPERDAVPVTTGGRAAPGRRPVPAAPSAAAAGPEGEARASANTYALAVVAGVAGFLVGRTPLGRLVRAAPASLSTAIKLTSALAAVDRLRAERRGKRVA